MMSGSRPNGRVSSASSTSSLAGQPSNSLMFRGLPLEADNDYILAFINIDRIAKGRDGQPLIVFFSFKEGQKFKNAKITFTDFAASKSVLDQWNQECPPWSNNKLNVSYWEEKQKNDNTRAANKPIQPSNCIVIQGLPENISVGQICSFVGGGIARGTSNQPLVHIFQEKIGYRSARVSLTTLAEARQFVEDNDGQPLPGYHHKLTIKYNEVAATEVRQAAAAGSKSVFIKGLFPNCNEDYLISLIGRQKIAIGIKGRPLVTVFPNHPSAKITFNTVADAQEFIANYHQKTLPLYDRNKLTVRFYLEGGEQTLSKPIVRGERHTDKAKAVVRNVVYIQGVNRTYTKKQLKEIVEQRTGTKIAHVNIYRDNEGRSEGRGTLTYRDAADAQLCIQALNGKKLEDTGVTLKLTLYESIKIRRLKGAIGNEHLFGPNAKGSAYECLGCLENWDERDMIGCVPLTRQTDPETHFLCQSCVRRYCESNKLDGRLGDHGTGFPCGEENCKRIMLWAPVNRVLTNRETAARLDKRMTDEALRDIEGIEFCKEEDCDFAAFLPNLQLMQFFSCQNPECRAQFCRICKISFMEHFGISCEANPRRRDV